KKLSSGARPRRFDSLITLSPSARSPVPPSSTRRCPSYTTSKQVVLPPNLATSGPAVAIEPRTPKNVTCMTLSPCPSERCAVTLAGHCEPHAAEMRGSSALHARDRCSSAHRFGANARRASVRVGGAAGGTSARCDGHAGPRPLLSGGSRLLRDEPRGA